MDDWNLFLQGIVLRPHAEMCWGKVTAVTLPNPPCKGCAGISRAGSAFPLAKKSRRMASLVITNVEGLRRRVTAHNPAKKQLARNEVVQLIPPEYMADTDVNFADFFRRSRSRKSEGIAYGSVAAAGPAKNGPATLQNLGRAYVDSFFIGDWQESTAGPGRAMAARRLAAEHQHRSLSWLSSPLTAE